MQHKVESKAKLPPYSSLKQYQSTHEQSKKLTKHPNAKSTKKIKQNKSVNQSSSKGKPMSKINKNNENYNSINVAHNEPPKLKIGHHQAENSKKQNRHEDKLKRNSSQKLIKTKSMSRLQLKSERRPISPSPLCSREVQPHPQDKQKTVKNVTSRSQREKKPIQKQKLKKSESKIGLNQKVEQTDRSMRNRVSIKTQMSSKTHSVIKQQAKPKGPTKLKQKKITSKQVKSERSKPFKIPKPGKAKLQQIVQRSILYSEVSFQQYNNGQNPCESAYISNDKYFLPYPDLKAVKTQGCQIENRSSSSISLARPEMVKAAIKIQKAFRGYITRKYINEAKYIINKVKIIQSWWRRVLQRKKQKLNHKITSASNSLITIKDFNDTFKTDKQKIFSESKENTLSNNKLNLKQFMKNILQENQSEKYSHSSSQKEEHEINLSKDKNLSRDMYVELKIKDQISSQRKWNFNSPKSLSSPSSVRTPTNTMFNMKEFFANGSNSNEKQKIKQLLQSPRINSPQQLKNTPQKVVKEQAKEIVIPEKDSEVIEAFQTNFPSIQQFCLLLVNYFRDKPRQMKEFISKLQSLKQFRTNLILKTWNSHSIYQQEELDLDQTIPADYEFLQPFQRPILFQKRIRDDILRFPEIQIDLLGKRFNLQSNVSGPIHRVFLQFVFDALQEAFYEQHRSTIITYGKSLNKYIFQNEQSLFENYFSSALGDLFKWGEIQCGFLADLPADQEFYREQRFKLFLKRMETWDMGQSHSVAIKIEASQKIVLQLLSQMEVEILGLI